MNRHRVVEVIYFEWAFILCISRNLSSSFMLSSLAELFIIILCCNICRICSSVMSVIPDTGSFYLLFFIDWIGYWLINFLEFLKELPFDFLEFSVLCIVSVIFTLTVTSISCLLWVSSVLLGSVYKLRSLVCDCSFPI